MTKPVRFQIKRTAGWRKPEGGVLCSRPGRWGNAWTIERAKAAGFKCDLQALVVSLHQNALFAGLPAVGYTVEDVKRELRGKDLGCWCRVGDPCHADTLLEVANADD